MREITGYQLIDRQTGKVLRTYGPDQGKAARRAVDRMDNAYGAYRYQARPIFQETTPTLTKGN